MKDVEKILEKAGVNQEHRDAVIRSIEQAKKDAKPVQKYKWTAPFVMFNVCRKLPWEAEHLPEKYMMYDNNISINGDNGNWMTDENGQHYRAPIPLDVKGNSLNDHGNPFNYYAPKKLSARHWFARYVWVGLRNRGCMAAQINGREMSANTALLRWEHGTKDEYALVILDPETGVAQVSHTVKRFGFFHVRKNLGYKLSNLNSIDTVASVIWIPFSFKIRARDVS